MVDREPKGNGIRGNRTGSSKIWLIIVLLVCVGVAVASFLFIKSGRAKTDGRQAQAATMRVIPVTASPARKGDVPVYLTGLGTVVPLHTVTVRSRVDGQLMEVLFREGQMVNRGDVLAQIDPRPFQVQLAQAEGQMAKDQALLKNAQLDLKRYEVLLEQDSVAKQQLDTQEALVRQYEGAIKTDQGAIDNARLQLTYCRITSPISGRIGLRLVDPGNIVRANDQNGLVVITQLQPITVIFPIPEDSLPLVVPRLKAKGDTPVEAYDREQKRKLAIGSLLTLDNQVDPNTGTVKVKATFPNKENELFPNQFVNVRLLADVKRSVTVIPAAAIQQGPKGAYVYVVKEDRSVAVRPVAVDEVQAGEAAVKEGLNPGELVVEDGAERLREGAKVEVKGEGGPGRKPQGRGAPGRRPGSAKG